MGPTGSVRATARREHACAGGYVGDAKPDEPYAGRREGDIGEGLRGARASPAPRCPVGGEVVCR